MYYFSMHIAPMQELKENLSALAEKAARGETVEITKHNKPFIRLVAAKSPGLHIGALAGKRVLQSAVRKNTGGTFLKVILADRE